MGLLETDAKTLGKPVVACGYLSPKDAAKAEAQAAEQGVHPALLMEPCSAKAAVTSIKYVVSGDGMTKAVRLKCVKCGHIKVLESKPKLKGSE